MNTPRLRSGLAVFALVACARPAHAQSAVTFSTLSPYVENFDDLNTAFPSGTYATASGSVTLGGAFPAIGANSGNPTVPVLIQPGLTWAGGATTDFSTGGFYSLNLSYSNTNSTRALRADNLTATDLAFGGKLGVTATLTGQFSNNTGADITGWNVAYAIERYTDGISATPTTVSFSYSANGTTYTPLGTDYSIGAGTANAQLASISSTAYGLNVPLMVADGASIYFRWTFVDPSSNGRHVAIDDLVVTPTAIPEPAAASALAGAALLGLALARRRRP